MIRPVSFGFNDETSADNVFMNDTDADVDVAKEAQREFDAAVDVLRYLKVIAEVERAWARAQRHEPKFYISLNKPWARIRTSLILERLGRA